MTEVLLVHCNAGNNNYQQNSKLFGQLLEISFPNFMFLKTFYSELSGVKVWFTNQNSIIEDKVNLTLIIN